MRFSDTFLRQVRDRVSIAEYAGKKLSWNARKTRAAAGDYWACCPFHQEKSASFHVLDQKGIFNCFGCGEKGDVFTLAMKLEGLSFPEAVERIAELAGMELPQDDFADRGEDARRKRLIQLAARTARLYSDALGQPRRQGSARLSRRPRLRRRTLHEFRHRLRAWRLHLDHRQAQGRWLHAGRNGRRRRGARRRRGPARHRHLPRPGHFRNRRSERQSHRLRRPRAEKGRESQIHQFT